MLSWNEELIELSTGITKAKTSSASNPGHCVTTSERILESLGANKDVSGCFMKSQCGFFSCAVVPSDVP